MPPSSEDLVKKIKEALRLKRSASDSPSEYRAARERSISSSYPSEGHVISPIQSPASPPFRAGTLSPSDIARFRQANDSLSNLFSSPVCSASSQEDELPVNEDAVVEATTATLEWQNECLAQSRRSLTLCPELRPSDSLSQREFPRTSTPADSQASTKINSPGGVPGRVPGGASGGAQISPPSSSIIQALKEQCDGAADGRLSISPEYAAPPRTWPSSDGLLKRSKRRVSQFLSDNATSQSKKRARLDLKRFVRNVCRRSSRPFSHMRHWWKAHSETEHKEFEAWKAIRRRDRPADPLKGKVEKGHSQFSFERSLFGNEDWWKEGVSRYQAPEWIVFGGLV